MIAALSAWHERHDVAAEALADVRVLPAHALLEAYAVLTRLPGGLAVEPSAAAEVLSVRFPDAPLRLSTPERRRLPRRLAAAGISGGASYDGLVGLEAAGSGHALLSLDARAARTYERLGIELVMCDASG